MLRVTRVSDSGQNRPHFLLENYYTVLQTSCSETSDFSKGKESFKVEIEKEGDSWSQRKRVLKDLRNGPQLPCIPLETYEVPSGHRKLMERVDQSAIP